MTNPAGKFGPYDATGAPSAVAATAPRAGLAAGRMSGGELVRSRIALQVRLAEIEPGDRLPDVGVFAEELGISEITVRRALETMRLDGLLDRRRGRAGGTFVAEGWNAVVAALHDGKQAEPLADFHLLLECGLVASRCGHTGAEDLAALWAIALRMDDAEDADEALRLETRFHLTLAQLLGDDAVTDRVADLLGRLSLMMPWPSLDTLRAQGLRHAALLRALEQGDIEAAVRAVQEHRGADAPGVARPGTDRLDPAPATDR